MYPRYACAGDGVHGIHAADKARSRRRREADWRVCDAGGLFLIARDCGIVRARLRPALHDAQKIRAVSAGTSCTVVHEMHRSGSECTCAPDGIGHRMAAGGEMLRETRSLLPNAGMGW